MYQELKHGQRVRVKHVPIPHAWAGYVDQEGTVDTRYGIVSIDLDCALPVMHVYSDGPMPYDLTGCVKVIESERDKQIRKLEDTITKAQSQVAELKENNND